MSLPLPVWKAERDRKTKHKEEGQAGFITMVAEQLGVIAKDDVSRLPEDQFKNIFLPLLAGDAELPYPVTIANWISIAGTPYKSVDVFDMQDGKVLFRVPPLFDYNGVNPVRDIHDRSKPALQELVHHAEHLANLHPMQGVNFMKAQLVHRAHLMNSGANLAKHVAVWNAIFARYDRPPLVAIEGVTPPTSEAAPVASSKGDIEYEDF